MKYKIYFSLIAILWVSCRKEYVVIQDIDKAQLRRTLREHRYQFNAEIILDVQKEQVSIGYSELDVTVNNVYLGKAVIGAETLSMNKGRQKLPFRVIFPDSILVLTIPNSIELSGYLTLDGRKNKIAFRETEMHVLNLTGM